jgi:hypothetical protein
VAAVGLEGSSWPCSNGHGYSNTDQYTHGDGNSDSYSIQDADPDTHYNQYARHMWSD